MSERAADLKDIKDISFRLTRDNKKYVIAVANALLFCQRAEKQTCKPSK